MICFFFFYYDVLVKHEAIINPCIFYFIKNLIFREKYPLGRLEDRKRLGRGKMKYYIHLKILLIVLFYSLPRKCT